MKNAIANLFSLLCISTVIFPTQSAESDYDITKPLNSSINRLFQNADSASVEELISAIESRKASNFETEIKFDVKPFENKFYFTSINVTVLNSKWSEFNYDYLSNKLNLTLAKLSIRLEGYAGATKSEAFAGFIRSLDFKNLVITATLSENLPDNKFLIDISSDSVEFEYIHLPWFRETLKQQEELEEKIKQTLTSVLIHNLNHNENFLQKLNQTFCKQATKKEIALKYRNFSHQEKQFYYSTQNVSSFRIILSNITINGLSNFTAFKFVPNYKEYEYDNSKNPEKHTLVIGNFRGKASLCYVTDNVTIFDLDFQTENATIWVNKRDQRIFVEVQNYSVIEVKSNASLTKEQSEWIMEGIGRAIAATLMPSMKICKTKNQVYINEDEKVHPVAQLFGEISKKFRWSSLNESFNNWTPFNGSYTATKLAFYPESYNYSISIHNMTIFPEIQNQYPYQIECHFFKMLQIIYNIDGNATGQVILRNTTDETVEIDFLVRFSFADQIIKRKENTAYDFKLWLAYFREPFIVELSTTNYTLSDDEKSVIINQINDTLLSMTRQIMLHNAEPLLSFPLDFCTVPEKPSTDFLPPFDDYQTPYVIPDGAIKGGQYFTSKIYNIILQGLSNFDLARVAFNKKDVSNFDYDSNDEAIGTFVEFPIYNITGRMGFNDSSVKFKELQLVLLNEMLLANATSEGKISVFPGYKYKLIPVPDDPGFSCYDSMWIMDKLEDIIENSLSKNEDSESKSDYGSFSFEHFAR